MDNYYLAADVSKGYADFIILDSHKRVAEDSFQLDDTYRGHRTLRELLDEFYRKHSDCTIYAAVESTGGLENNWLHFFLEFGSAMNLKAARINPLTTSAYYKATLTRVVNDRISAKTIAEYMIACPEKIRYNVDDPYAEMRRLWSFLQMLKKQRTQLENQFQILIYTSLPFLVRYMRHGIPNWLYELLVQYPSAKNLAEAEVSALSKIPYISRKRAEKIVEQAKTTVGSSTQEATSFLIESMVRQIIELSKSIKKQNDYLSKHYGELPLVKLLESFKGIGTLSAIGLLVNIVSVELFPTVKNLSAFFGVHPVYKQSGDGSCGFHMSKQGRSGVRAILFMVALAASRSNPLIKEYYTEQIKKGKSRMSALGICMHKILRIVYGMLKNNKPFDADIDKQNRNKQAFAGVKKNNHQQRKNKIKEADNQNRGFHLPDEEAPISRRQNQKRKKRKQSQSELIA